jgi:hypothetical protein
MFGKIRFILVCILFSYGCSSESEICNEEYSVNNVDLLEETNFLMSHYLTLRNQLLEDTRPLGNLRVEQSQALLDLLSSFTDKLENLHWSENRFIEINSIENEYLLDIVRIFNLESIEELDNVIIGDFKLKCELISFPIDLNTKRIDGRDQFKETVQGEILKAKIVMSYSMNFLFR